MAMKKVLFGILVFTVAVTVCAEASTLSGSWQPQEGGANWRFDNGNLDWVMDGTSIVRGRYSTSGFNVTIQIMEIRGTVLTELLPDATSGWYSRPEVRAAAGLPPTERVLDPMFRHLTETYSVTGNTLTIITTTIGTLRFTRI